MSHISVLTNSHPAESIAILVGLAHKFGVTLPTFKFTRSWYCLPVYVVQEIRSPRQVPTIVRIRADQALRKGAWHST
jgi:hypothetical protein